MDFKGIFFVVNKGKPSSILKRIWYPQTAIFPTPWGSPFLSPFSKTYFNKSRYCFMLVLYYKNKKEPTCVDSTDSKVHWNLTIGTDGGHYKVPVQMIEGYPSYLPAKFLYSFYTGRWIMSTPADSKTFLASKLEPLSLK